MASTAAVDWDRIAGDPSFQALHRRKGVFLWGLMGFSVVWYFLLPIGAAYFQDVFRIRVWGVINVGLMFALSEFALAWIVAWLYSRKASGDFDVMAAKICADCEKSLLAPSPEQAAVARGAA